MATKLYLIRHGETVENVAHILQGQIDGNLSERGIQQAKDARVVILPQSSMKPMDWISTIQNCLENVIGVV